MKDRPSQNLHPVDRMLSFWQLGFYGIQHVLTFYAGAVVVPVFLANSLGLSRSDLQYLIEADLFTCGIACLIQAAGIGRYIGVRLPLLQGVSFAAVPPMIAIGLAQGGGSQSLPEIFGAVMAGGVFAALIAPLFSRFIRIFPPVVIGTVLLVIGLALLPVAVNDIVRPAAIAGAPHIPPLRSLGYGVGTLLFILLIQRLFKGFMAKIAVLLGLVVGTVIAWCMGDVVFCDVSSASWVAVAQPFYFGWPRFQLVSMTSMCVVVLVTMLETTGDVFATGTIVRKEITPADIVRALRADGLATLIGGIFNSFPYTCLAQNMGLVRLTGVVSRWVAVAAGVLTLVLGCFPKLAAVISSVPVPVLGGASLVLFSAVAVVGIQTLSKVDFDNPNNTIIIGTSIGLSMLVTAQPRLLDFFPVWVKIIFGSGITMGAVAAILLNLIFNVDFRAFGRGVCEKEPEERTSLPASSAHERL